ncbi:MAG: hypothetical protein GWP91_08875 [Rhodobacterales bacterium]|nr:hypothetical protein [Rhodobacterales bacterium]
MMLLVGLLLSVDATAQDQFQFVVVGDTQTDGGEDSVNWDVLTQLMVDMNTHDPLFGLFVGDLVGGTGTVAGTIGQWNDFLNATAPFIGERLPLLGNHDVYGGAGTFNAFATTFDWLPQDDSPTGEEGVSYYMDYGNTRIVGITSDQEVGPSYQVSAGGMAWLDRVLGESDHFDHVFVMTHHPVTFSSENSHGGTGGDFWQTLAAYGVTGLFSGHWHRYQPSQPGAGTDTWETIIGTGGGWTGFEPIRDYQQMWGFLLVEVDGPRATATFYADEDGDGAYDDPMDTFTLADDVPPTTGLLARYTFEEGSVVDSAPQPLGREIDGVLNNDAHIDADPARSSVLYLDGARDHVEAGAIDDYVLSLNGDVSLSWWAWADSLDDAAWPNAMLVYATNDYFTEDEETNYSYWASIESDKTLRAFWEYGSGTNVNVYSTVPAPIALGAWHHLALTRSAADMEVRFYVDGSMLGDPVAFDTLPTGGGRGMLYLGSDTTAYAGDSNFHGRLDDICLFNAVLDAAQVGTLAANGDCEAMFGDTEDTETTEDTDTKDTDTKDTDTRSNDDGDGNEADESPRESSGCGCSSPGSGSAGWGGLALLLLVARRRLSPTHSGLSPE